MARSEHWCRQFLKRARLYIQTDPAGFGRRPPFHGGEHRSRTGEGGPAARSIRAVKPRSQFAGFTLPNWVPPLGPLLDSRSGGRAPRICFRVWLKGCQVLEPSGQQPDRSPGRRPPDRARTVHGHPPELDGMKGKLGPTAGFVPQPTSGSERSGVRVWQITSGGRRPPAGRASWGGG